MPDSPSPLVAIVMGSDSDWPKIKSVAAALDEFHVPHEIREAFEDAFKCIDDALTISRQHAPSAQRAGRRRRRPPRRGRRGSRRP